MSETTSEKTRDERIEAQGKEFDKLEILCQKYRSLPLIVDDNYPEARHYYERALCEFISALRENDRI